MRILNGAQTALVSKALLLGIETVRTGVEHGDVGLWLRRVLFEAIVPTVANRVDGAEIFAQQVLERFANPFLEHKLADIALYSRCQSSGAVDVYIRRIQGTARSPAPLLHELLSVS